MRKPVAGNPKITTKLPQGVLIDEALNLSTYNKFWVSKKGDVITQSEKTIDGKRVRKTYRLHRIVMGAKPSEQVDHINRNKLDNRKSNLRICTQLQNGKNLSIKKNNTSGFPGVQFDKRRNKWRARIKVNYVDKLLGRYGTIDEAISARLFAEDYYYGEFAPNLGGK